MAGQRQRQLLSQARSSRAPQLLCYPDSPTGSAGYPRSINEPVHSQANASFGLSQSVDPSSQLLYTPVSRSETGSSEAIDAFVLPDDSELEQQHLRVTDASLAEPSSLQVSQTSPSLLVDRLFDDSAGYQVMSDWLQFDETTTTTFSDDRVFEVPLLNLLNAAQILAGHLHCLDRLFNLEAPSVFYKSSPSLLPWITTLPSNLQPTPAQFALPHHPLLDLIPWPSVRTKLICVLSQTGAMVPRDHKDGSVLDFMRFVHDTDDGGFLVRGQDPTEAACWELGSAEFARTWWWAFDGEVWTQTNAKRRSRGLPALSLT